MLTRGECPLTVLYDPNTSSRFVGLPPSWSNALSQAGFTDDEIAAIHARRTAVRGNPNALRPDSPLSILHHPAPRSSSLAARSSNATLIANAYINAPSPSSFNFPPFRQSSYTATSSSHSPSAIEGDTVDTQYVFVNGTGHESMIDPYPLDTQSVSTHHSSSNHSNTPQIARVQSEGPPRSNSGHVPSPLVHSRSLPLSHDPLDAHSIHSASPRTPPRRVFHVSNADESPPPAYHSPLHTSVFRDKPGFSSEGSGSGMEKESGQLKEKERDVDSILDISATTNTTSSSLYTDTDLSLPDVDPALLNRHMSPTPPLVIDKRLTKLGALPPRLSFHLSSDLGLEDWGAGLLTGLEDGSGSGGGSRLEDRLGLSKSGKFVESKRSSLLADRGEGSSSSLLPGFSLSSSSSSSSSSSRLSPSPSPSPSLSLSLSPSTLTSCSPSTSSRPSTPLSLKSHSPSTSAATSTPSTSPSHSPSESAQSVLSPLTSSLLTPTQSTSSTLPPLTSSMLSPTSTQTLPTLPDVSFGANITLGAPLRIMVPKSPPPGKSVPSTPTTRSTLPPTTTRTPLTPMRNPPMRELPPVPPEEVEVDCSIGPVLPDISLGPNVSSLGVGLDLSSLGVEVDVSGGPKIPSSSTQIPSTKHTDPTKPSSPPACNSRIDVSVSQSPTSATLSSKISGGDSSRGEGVGTLMTGDPGSMTSSPMTRASTFNRSPPSTTSDRNFSTTLLPLRPAGDRDSGMSTMTVTPVTIVSVSGAVAITLATASVVDSDSVSLSAVEPRDDAESETEDGASAVLDSDDASMALDSDPTWPEPPLTPDLDTTPRQSTRFRTTSLRVQGSPHSSHFSSDTGSTSESAPLVTPKLHVPPSPLRDKSFAPEAALLTSTTDTFGVGGRDSDSDDGFTLSLPKAHSQSQRLPGWIADAVSPLSEFMVDVDPQEYFADLQEIAEGESGSVYAARLVCPPNTLSLPLGTTHVAIKAIAIHPAVSPKLQDLSHEMELMRGVHHDHVLRMDAFYVNLVDDSVWIRMELMERSLADVVGLVGEGLSLQERMIARFASDVSPSFCYVCGWSVY